MRCSHCEYRYSWDCEDWWKSDDYLCDRFKLDFDTLTDLQKELIQTQLMGESYDS